MIIATNRTVREKAVQLMSNEDSNLVDAMENFRHLKGKPIYLEPVAEYGSEKEVIVCGPFQQVPDNAVYTNDQNYHKYNTKQLYIGENCLASQYPYEWHIRNDSFMFLSGGPKIVSDLKREVVSDFVVPAFSEVYPSQRYVIFKTLEDKKIIFDTLEGMIESISRWGNERNMAKEEQGRKIK